MRRKRIGLIFSYDELWLGGTYYILNLVNAFNVLEENLKPELIIFSNPIDFNILFKETQYPYLIFVYLSDNPQSKVLRLINRISKKAIGKKFFSRRCKKEIDAVFPFRKFDYFRNVPLNKQIYWIPDFQEKHFPEFYSEKHLEFEKKKNSEIVYEAEKLLLSSKSALDDLKEFYPGFKTSPIVVHFAVKIPELSTLPSEDILLKYTLPKNYFFVPNQFWRHKNHLVLIKAVEILRQKGTSVVVAFSGKEHDYRAPDYTTMLKKYVIDNDLSDNIKFLGFLDRQDQLKLMESCSAVIQPSLFEGWSTVIEEAMAMNKIVIASDLKVNIEQLGDLGLYFERNTPSDLAIKIQEVLGKSITRQYDYKSKQIKFANDFLNII